MIRPDTVIAVFADHPSSEPAVKRPMADGFGIKCVSIVGNGYYTDEKVAPATASYSRVVGSALRSAAQAPEAVVA